MNDNCISKFLACLALSATAVAASAFASDPPPNVASGNSQEREFQTAAIFDRVDRAVHLSEDQKPKVRELIEKYQPRFDEVRSNSSMKGSEKKSQTRQIFAELVAEIKPILTEEQAKRLDTELFRKKKFSFHRNVVVSYEDYFPTSSETRSIYGNSISSFSASLGEIQPLESRRLVLGYSIGTLGINGSKDKLFIATPQLSIEYRTPIEKRFTLYEKLSAGPSYMDYSFNNPAGEHFGAKRLGADAGLEVGLRYGPLQLSISYQVMTEPAGINFDGFQFAAHLVVFRF